MIPQTTPTTPDRASFRAVVHAEAGGGYWAEVPDLPGCLTQGETLDEIYHNLPEAIACHLDTEPERVRIRFLEIAATA